ncbi:histidinol-phosphate transaminase [Massilia sp. W12]|uniref:histidinol-phosphate transaminase n=1 Tax=Massilia sp. W12 TaxID=3126507 RepID=UPI0030CD43DB
MSVFGLDYVRALAPYQAGKPISEVAREFGLDESKIIKLASNENPLGVPASSVAAMQSAMADLARYPDANGFDLKAALASRFGVPQNWLTLGNGSNDILELAAHALVAPGESVIFSEYAFAVYPLATQAVGGRALRIPARDYGHDLDAMAAAVQDDTKLIYVANPNNPTGAFIAPDALHAFLKKIPQRVVVVLDEAYNEYLPADLQYDAVAWLKEFPNLLISRTMSKAYGLAGLRVGFAIAQAELTDILNRIRQPFNVNSLAQAAAVAALNDSEFLAKTAALNNEGNQQLCAGFKAMGLEYVPSYANFVLVKVGDDDGAGARINLALLKQGLIVRPVGNYGLPQWLRISIGLPHENAALLAGLQKALQDEGRA